MQYQVYVKASGVVKGATGWGAVVRTPDGEIWELARAAPFESDLTTTVRATLLGIVEMLGVLPNPVAVNITIDVEYIADGFTTYLAKWVNHGWRRKDRKPVAHRDLWERVILESSRHEVSIVWKKYHPDAHRALELAEMGREGERVYTRLKGS